MQTKTNNMKNLDIESTKTLKEMRYYLEKMGVLASKNLVNKTLKS